MLKETRCCSMIPRGILKDNPLQDSKDLEAVSNSPL